MGFDIAITQAVNGLSGRWPPLDFAMLAVTYSGVPAMALAVAAQWWRVPKRSALRHDIVAAGLTFLLGLAINQVVLLFVHRARPYDVGVSRALVARTADPSFPSDHATAAFAIVFAMFAAGRRGQGAAFAAAALLVSFSRLYVGAHWFTDLLGGAATAAIAAIVVARAYRPGTALDRFATGIF